MMRLTTKFTWRHVALLALVIGFLVFGFYAFSANAQDVMTGLKSAAGAAGLPGKPTGGFEAAIGAIIGSVMGLIGTILFVYMLYGGFKWMTAGGDNKAVTDAQSIIKNAIIGIAIIVFAYTLTSFVINTLSSASSGAPPATTASTPATTGGGTATCGAVPTESGYTSYFCMADTQCKTGCKCSGPLNCDSGQLCCANPQ